MQSIEHKPLIERKKSVVGGFAGDLPRAILVKAPVVTRFGTKSPGGTGVKLTGLPAGRFVAVRLRATFDQTRVPASARQSGAGQGGFV